MIFDFPHGGGVSSMAAKQLFPVSGPKQVWGGPRSPGHRLQGRGERLSLSWEVVGNLSL
jgi:hypothetical protein